MQSGGSGSPTVACFVNFYSTEHLDYLFYLTENTAEDLAWRWCRRCKVVTMLFSAGEAKINLKFVR